jgi:hypothetical protein
MPNVKIWSCALMTKKRLAGAVKSVTGSGWFLWRLSKKYQLFFFCK